METTTTTAPKPLRKLDVPPPDEGPIWDAARAEARRLASEISTDGLRDYFRSAGHPDLAEQVKDQLAIARALYQCDRGYAIARDLANEANAEYTRRRAVAARDAVAEAYGLDPGELTRAKARELLDQSWDRCCELGESGLIYQADGAAQRRARAARTRADTQHWRLDDYLQAAGLAPDYYDEDGNPVYAEEVA